MKTKTTFQAVVFCLFISLNSWSQNTFSSMLIESWTGAAWENSAQTTNTFDGNDFVANSLTQTWLVPTTEWQNTFQTNFTNNSSGTVAQSVSQSWDTGSSTWGDISRTTNTYNASDQLLSYVTEIYVGIWMNSAKGTNTYGSGYLTNSLIQTWDFLGSIWNNSTQTTYTNNANGTVNQSVTQTWSGAWVNQSRSTYTYNASSKVLTDLTETWSGSAWVNSSLETYTYDGSGFLTQTVTQEWVAASWQNDSQSLFTNNPAGNPVQIVNQSWNAVESIWENESRITLTYNLGITDFGKTTFTLFPNPATNTVTIKSNAGFSGQLYRIIDDKGQIILSGGLDSDESVLDVNNLQSGLYFIQIGTSKTAAKMIKK